LLNRGTDTDEVLRRFHSERQILAGLDHPNIARLLDAGTSDDALPYFVMEYVDGTRVTEFVRERRLSIAERLELFRKICAAVQFAHQNLIIHRDLKPGNILVTAEGEPKLLDFGIAKLLSPGNDAWEMTLAGRERLTPGYASPEQVRGEPVTTVSDVYALGALLYEVLAERPAHRFGSSPPTQTEILRVVCEQEPVRPSAAAVDSERRRQLRGDLDTIVLRAMAKARERRYRGAGHLADDLRRHLEGRPVRARPDTFTYRASKFLLRNKTGVAAAALVLIALVAGVIATTFEARNAEHQRARAERRFKDLRKISNSLMFELHNAIRDLPGALAARQLVIRRALEYLDSLAQEAGDDLSLKSELATAYGKIGLVTFDVQQAINSHRKAATLNEELVQSAPQKAAYRKQLSDSYNNLSDVMKIAGHSAESIDLARRSLDLMRSLAAANSDDDDLQAALADRHLSLGIALEDAGDYTGAIGAERDALQIQQKVVGDRAGDAEALHSLAAIYGNLSDALADSGDYAAALEYGRHATNISRKFFEADPSNARSRRERWASLFRAGSQLAAIGQKEDALSDVTEAVALIEGLAAADPNDIGHKRWLAVTYLRFADLLAALDRNAEALDRYDKAAAIAEQLVATDPNRVEVRSDLARIYEARGLIDAKLRQTDRALRSLEAARATAETSAQRDPRNARVRDRLAKISAELADLQQSAGR
jgi:serine/threonine protein kinase